MSGVTARTAAEIEMATLSQSNDSSGESRGFCSCYDEILRHSFVIETARVAPIASRATVLLASAANSRIPQLILRFFGNHQSGGGFLNDPTVLKHIGRVKLLVGVGGIIGLGTIVSEALEINLQLSKGRSAERNDAILRLIEAVSATGDSVASFAMGLSLTGHISDTAVAWAPFLGVASSILSTITIAINARSWIHGNEILDKLTHGDKFLCSRKERYDQAMEQLRWLKEEIDNHDKKQDGHVILKRHFEIINDKRYAAQIQFIIKNPNQDEDSINKKTDLVRALKTRISDKITSNQLAILSAVIGLIASAILFFPGFAPILLGFTLVGLAGLISLVKFIKDRQSVRILEERIDELCDFDELNPEWIKENAHFAVELLPESPEIHSEPQKKEKKRVITNGLRLRKASALSTKRNV